MLFIANGHELVLRHTSEKYKIVLFKRVKSCTLVMRTESHYDALHGLHTESARALGAPTGQHLGLKFLQ